MEDEKCYTEINTILEIKYSFLCSYPTEYKIMLLFSVKADDYVEYLIFGWDKSKSILFVLTYY